LDCLERAKGKAVPLFIADENKRGAVMTDSKCSNLRRKSPGFGRVTTLCCNTVVQKEEREPLGKLGVGDRVFRVYNPQA
jgi:hypothetical protein